MKTLARQAAFRGRKRLETLVCNRLRANDAHAIRARCNTTQCCLDIAQLLHVTRDLRHAHIHQQIRQCIVFRVMNFAGNARILLGIRTQEGGANLRAQLLRRCAQSVTERRGAEFAL